METKWLKVDDVRKLTRKAISNKNAAEAAKKRKELQAEIQAIVQKIDLAIKAAAEKGEWECSVCVSEDTPDYKVQQPLEQRYEKFRIKIEQEENERWYASLNWGDE